MGGGVKITCIATNRHNTAVELTLEVVTQMVGYLFGYLAVGLG